MKKLFAATMLLLAALTSVSAQKKPYSVTWKNFNTYSTRLPEVGKLATKIGRAHV